MDLYRDFYCVFIFDEKNNSVHYADLFQTHILMSH